MSSLQMKDRIRAEIVTPEAKRDYVQGLFGRIADRYDLTNDLMSAGLHRRWKRLAVNMAQIGDGHVVLDLAAGTGDLSLIVGAGSTEGYEPSLVVAADLTVPMMQRGRERSGAAAVRWLACDAMDLPFPEASVDRCLVGYGLRNFPDLGQCLRELRRVLKPGGRLVTLDFGRAEPQWLDRAYLRYLEASGSVAGWIMHRDIESYRYIAESLRTYPAQRAVATLMQYAGFVRCGSLDLMFGTMAINFGDVPN